jgi:DNA replication protein DnaC
VNTADINIDALLRRLHLANARRTWRDMIARAEKESWSCRDFFAVLVAEEVAHRQQTRIQRLSSRGGFPFLKTVDDFDFTYQSTVKLALLGSALSPDFVTDGRSLILHGKSGRGKTHIAVAIGYRAIQNGFDTLFVTAAGLIEDLSVASRDGRLADALVPYVTPHVLVVDEVGYLTYGHDAANVLYHVVTKRHQAKRSMIFTSNKHPDAWGAVLHDDDLAAAIVDRVLERGRLLHLDGPSMRTKHLGLDAPAHADAGSQQVVRISGTSSSEFPEPTGWMDIGGWNIVGGWNNVSGCIDVGGWNIVGECIDAGGWNNVGGCIDVGEWNIVGGCIDVGGWNNVGRSNNDTRKDTIGRRKDLSQCVHSGQCALDERTVWRHHPRRTTRAVLASKAATVRVGCGRSARSPRGRGATALDVLRMRDDHRVPRGSLRHRTTHGTRARARVTRVGRAAAVRGRAGRRRLSVLARERADSRRGCGDGGRLGEARARHDLS